MLTGSQLSVLQKAGRTEWAGAPAKCFTLGNNSKSL